MKYYDALDDEYATYYFANPTVKKHFKRLEKVSKGGYVGCQEGAEDC